MSEQPAEADAISQPAAGSSSVPGDISIKIKTLDGQTHQLTVSSEMLGSELKVLMEGRTGIPVARQRLIYHGHMLEDSTRLTGAGVRDGHSIHLVERPADAPLPSQAPAGATSTASGQLPPPRVAMGSISLPMDAQGGIEGLPDMNQVMSQMLSSLGVDFPLVIDPQGPQGAGAQAAGVAASGGTGAAPGAPGSSAPGMPDMNQLFSQVMASVTPAVMQSVRQAQAQGQGQGAPGNVQAQQPGVGAAGAQAGAPTVRPAAPGQQVRNAGGLQRVTRATPQGSLITATWNFLEYLEGTRPIQAAQGASGSPRWPMPPCRISTPPGQLPTGMPLPVLRCFHRGLSSVLTSTSNEEGHSTAAVESLQAMGRRISEAQSQNPPSGAGVPPTPPPEIAFGTPELMPLVAAVMARLLQHLRAAVAARILPEMERISGALLAEDPPLQVQSLNLADLSSALNSAGAAFLEMGRLATYTQAFAEGNTAPLIASTAHFLHSTHGHVTARANASGAEGQPGQQQPQVRLHVQVAQPGGAPGQPPGPIRPDSVAVNDLFRMLPGLIAPAVSRAVASVTTTLAQHLRQPAAPTAAATSGGTAAAAAAGFAAAQVAYEQAASAADEAAARAREAAAAAAAAVAATSGTPVPPATQTVSGNPVQAQVRGQAQTPGQTLTQPAAPSAPSAPTAAATVAGTAASAVTAPPASSVVTTQQVDSSVPEGSAEAPPVSAARAARGLGLGGGLGLARGRGRGRGRPPPSSSASPTLPTGPTSAPRPAMPSAPAAEAGGGGRGLASGLMAMLNGPAGEGLMSMAQEMAQSPAMAGLADRMGGGASEGGPPPDFGQMMNAMMPMVQNMLGGLGQPGPSGPAQPGQQVGTPRVVEEDSWRGELSEEQAAEWAQIIAADEEAMAGASSEPLSDVYLQGSVNEPRRGGGLF